MDEGWRTNPIHLTLPFKFTFLVHLSESQSEVVGLIRERILGKRFNLINNGNLY